MDACASCRRPAGYRKSYHLRHTFASFSIAANVPLFYLARIMGTSVAQIDATYGHLLPDSEGFLRGLLDEWDARPATPERGFAGARRRHTGLRVGYELALNWHRFAGPLAANPHSSNYADERT